VNFSQTFILTVDGHDLPLLPGGETVLLTDVNKQTFVALVAGKRLLEGFELPVQAIVKGFHAIIPLRHSGILSVDELDRLITGPLKLNVPEMKQFVAYTDGYDRNSRVIHWFWEAVESMNEEQQKKLLAFWSGTPVPPFSFDPKASWDNDRWTVERADEAPTALPKASACSYLLHLPPYRTAKELKDKLLLAVELGYVGFAET